VSFAVRFPPQPETDAAGEFFEVELDGAFERMRVQDYERLYAVPGLYEEVVQRRLGCRTPDRMADMLAAAAAQLGREPASVRILDVGAGNGVSGEALAARGMRPVVGLDILPAARDAALRDRPGVYDAYLAADLCALAPDEEQLIRDAAPNALACVGAVGAGHLPAEAVAAALELLPADALVTYAYDVEQPADPLQELLAGARQLARECALHRRTVTGGERHWEAVVVELAGR
jgi:predicted TPR repeat methyltransferase